MDTFSFHAYGRTSTRHVLYDDGTYILQDYSKESVYQINVFPKQDHDLTEGELQLLFTKSRYTLFMDSENQLVAWPKKPSAKRLGGAIKVYKRT